MEADQTLSARQKGILPIAAMTAIGDLERLRTALANGLDAGLTVNEIKEILVQMYAYAGFPRSLNALNTFARVLEERRDKGIQDELGREASPLPEGIDKETYGAQIRATITGRDANAPPIGYQVFAPIIDTFLKTHLFADIFGRDVLNYQDRELATVAALTAMTATEVQLQAHLGVALNVGLTERQLRDLIEVLRAWVGEDRALSAQTILNQILESERH